MEKELLRLYEEYLKDLGNYNITKSPIQDWQEPSFKTFMVWLLNKQDQET